MLSLPRNLFPSHFPFSFSPMDPLLRVLLMAAASLVLLILILAPIILIAYKRNKTTSHSQPQSHSQLTSSHTTADNASGWSWCLLPNVQLSMDEIAKATDDFSSRLVLGKGRFGKVYKARLSNGHVVAAKILPRGSFHGFRAEVETLGKLRHRNIVKLLGSWTMGREGLLVLEFMEGGSLYKLLYGYDGDPLPWEARVKIMSGVANGLCYLHGLERPVIHRNIKSSNVLLDSQLQARISDFGLARIISPAYSHSCTEYEHTLGYMPPEYTNDGVKVATVKLDVYSFGVLMLETATRRRPYCLVKWDGKEIGLVDWAREMEAQNKEMDMVDDMISWNLMKSTEAKASVKEFFRIALMCCSKLQTERPQMAEIVELLDRMP